MSRLGPFPLIFNTQSVMHNTSVRMFGFKDADPSRRHKAQFNGCTVGSMQSLFLSVLDGVAAIATACRIRWKHVNISCPGTQCKHSEILSFFDEVFGAKYKMGKIQVEPNSVFSATDNAVMDPAYGIHIEGLVNCLKSSKLVEHYKEQVMITHVTPDGCNRVHSAAGCWNDAKIRGGHTVASRARPH
jgi:hypothetical protein